MCSYKLHKGLLWQWRFPCFPWESWWPRRCGQGWRRGPRPASAQCWSWRPPGSWCLQRGAETHRVTRELKTERCLDAVVDKKKKKTRLKFGYVVSSKILIYKPWLLAAGMYLSRIVASNQSVHWPLASTPVLKPEKRLSWRENPSGAACLVPTTTLTLFQVT